MMPRPSSLLVGALAIQFVVSGCLSATAGNPDASPGSTPAYHGALPRELRVEQTDPVERNDTFARFVIESAAPPGQAGNVPRVDVAAALSFTLPIPADLPVALFVGLRFARTPNEWLNLQVEDTERSLLCRGEDWAALANGDTWITCAHAIRPLARSQVWRARVVSEDVKALEHPFTLEVRYRVDPRILSFDRLPGPAPGCEPTPRLPGQPNSGAGAGKVAAPWTVCQMNAGPATFEPTLGFSPDGTVFGGPYREFFHADGDGEGKGLVRSRDSGATWEPLYPHVGGVPTHRVTGDPYLHVDPVTGRVFVDNLFYTVHCSTISWSDDGGRTWDHTLGGCDEADHQTLFTGRPVSSATLGYPRLVYRCGINGGAATASTLTTCSKSLDGGRTWMPTGLPAFGPGVTSTPNAAPASCGADATFSAPGHGVVADDGRILLPQGYCGAPMLAISDDEGGTWRSVVVSDRGLLRENLNPLLVDQHVFDHEGNVGIDADGTIMYAWIAADHRPYLTYSTDDGSTWAEPVLLGAPELVEARLAALAVAGRGVAAFAYVGTEGGPGAPWTGSYEGTLWGGYLGVVRGVGTGDVDVEATTIHPEFDPITRGDCQLRCGWVGDFIDVQVAPDGTPWAVFGDVCDEGCALYEDAVKTFSPSLVFGRLVGDSLWDLDDPRGIYDEGTRPFFAATVQEGVPK